MTTRLKNLAVDLDDLGAAVIVLTPEGEWVLPNLAVCELLGLSREMLLVRSFDNVFPVGNGPKEAASLSRLKAGEIVSYYSERTAQRSDGSTFRARLRFSALRNHASSELAGILVGVDDLSTLKNAEHALELADTARRELARRLTDAQEEERTRMARELHDDIGQALLILSIQLLRAGKPVSGMPGRQHPGIAELCAKLREVALRVSRLSHQLHSSALEYLGLAAALRGHCREFSEQYKIAVDCSCEAIPGDLDDLLALAVLRVVQEALHNTAKHGQAKAVRVQVHGSPARLTLRVEDDGVGFDLEHARLAAGLGLISMRERVHLAGGDFKVSSVPGKGTIVTAEIPLQKHEVVAV